MRTRKTPLRAIVADDHPVVVKGIQHYLEREADMQVVATAYSTLQLAETLDAMSCDYLFCDIGMQGLEGENSSISFLRRLSWQRVRPRLIVVTMISHGRMLAGLIQMGIDGVVDKRDGLEYLATAVAAVQTGKRFLSPSADAALHSLPTTSTPRAGVLSRREWEVFRLYASGLLVHQIAEQFGRSRKTIATQKRSGMRKLGLESEGELVEYFRQVGLV